MRLPHKVDELLEIEEPGRGVQWCIHEHATTSTKRQELNIHETTRVENFEEPGRGVQ